MSRRTDRIVAVLGDFDGDETMTIAQEALDLLGIAQIITLVLDLDPVTKQDLLEALAEEGGAK